MYEQSISQYVVFSLADDSISVTKGEKEYEIRRQKKTATIDSSLWEAIVGAGMPASLAAEMEDIYQSTISFFSIQKGDNFTVIYDERYIDTLPAGIGRIWGAKFNYGGKTYYAIPFRQGNKIAYWDQDGNSLRKFRDAYHAAQIYTHRLPVHLFAAPPHLQNLPSPYGRRFRSPKGTRHMP